MKMLFEGTPAEIAEMFKRIKSEPGNENENKENTLLADSTGRVHGGTGTAPWNPGETLCCDHAEEATTDARQHRAN